MQANRIEKSEPPKKWHKRAQHLRELFASALVVAALAVVACASDDGSTPEPPAAGGAGGEHGAGPEDDDSSTPQCPKNASTCPASCLPVQAPRITTHGCLGAPETVACHPPGQGVLPDAGCAQRDSDHAAFFFSAGYVSWGEDGWSECDEAAQSAWIRGEVCE